MTGDTPSPHSLELTDGDRTVTVRKQRTPNGERLAIRGADGEIRLDALALESLTWQDADFFERLTTEPHLPGENATNGSDELQIGNEYAVVRLRTLETNAGPRVAIESVKMGYSCRLSPAELDALTREGMGFFSSLLETPLGPESDHHHGVH